jgi:hypothetical protein
MTQYNRRVSIEVDFSSLLKDLPETRTEIYQAEIASLARKAEQLFPEGMKIKKQGHKAPSDRKAKGDIGTILAIVVVAGYGARSVASLLSSIAALIRSITELKRVTEPNKPLPPEDRHSPPPIELNGVLYNDYEELISFVQTELKTSAADTDPVFQKKEIKYHLRVKK